MIDDQFIAEMAGKCLTSAADLDAVIRAGSAARIQTVNLHHLALAERDAGFAEVIRTADYVTADGFPIVSLMEHHGLHPERVTGSELVERMVSTRDFSGLRVAVLGADDARGDHFEAMLTERGMVVEFRDHGHRDAWDADEIAARLADEAVDLLLIAVTPPYGDSIAERVRRAGFAGVVVNVGGSINMVTGGAVMAPRWARVLNVEWLYRFAQEPRRLFRRYFVQCLPTYARVVLPRRRRRGVAVEPVAVPVPVSSGPDRLTEAA